MIARLFIIAGLCGAAAMTVPLIAQRTLTAQPDTAPVQAEPARVRAASAPAATGGRDVALSSGADGHFRAAMEMNGRTVEGLIDTGATSVAINETTARQIGLSPATLDYSLRASTANGMVKAAPVVIRRLTIGSISVDDVAGVVLPDTALAGTLVGMSFLGRLSSFQVEDGVLKLRR